MVWRITVEDALYYWIKSPKGAAMYAKTSCIHVQKGKINISTVNNSLIDRLHFENLSTLLCTYVAIIALFFNVDF